LSDPYDEIDQFIEMIEKTLCADFIEYMELVEGIGFYIPFITTVNYLSHPESRKHLKIKDYSKLLN
jgi:hypothetical protein